jgi:hypothetical protein
MRLLVTALFEPGQSTPKQRSVLELAQMLFECLHGSVQPNAEPAWREFAETLREEARKLGITLSKDLPVVPVERIFNPRRNVNWNRG